MDPVRALEEEARRFGPAAARAKRRLLEQLLAVERLPLRSLVRLQDQLAFLRAHPDDAGLARLAGLAVERLRELAGALGPVERAERGEGSGLAGTWVRQPFSYALARALLRVAPERVGLDAELVEPQGALYDTLGSLVLPAESPALDDVRTAVLDWLARVGGISGRSPLAVLVGLLEDQPIAPALRAALFESCAVPLVLRLDAPGDGRAEAVLPVERVAYQRGAPRREHWPLAPHLRAPLTRARRVPARQARWLLDRMLLCLAGRGLEIFPLTHADPRDLTRFVAGRGVEVWLAGVVPAERCAFEALFFFLVSKNGVPVAYGPASPFLGCCELGINLFPEFRGGETRFLYAAVMRVLHHVLGVERFHVTPYGMGRRNPEALASGAFWFYRKLGFATTNPAVESLAQAEERRMRGEPGYRSDRRTLRRLSDTAAVLDLSGGACAGFDSSALAQAATALVEREHGGERRAAPERLAARLRRRLGLGPLAGWSGDERESLRRMAPVLVQLDLARWSARERAALVRLVRGKAARSEAPTARAFARHRRLAEELRKLA